MDYQAFHSILKCIFFETFSDEKWLTTKEALIKEKVPFPVLQGKTLPLGEAEDMLSIANLLCVQSLSTSVLRGMWDLTRSDGGSVLAAPTSLGLPTLSLVVQSTIFVGCFLKAGFK